MLDQIVTAVAAANLAAGAAVLVVLALRRLVRPRFGARAAYALWAAPLLAPAAALLPHPVRETAIAPIVLTMTEAASRVLPAAVTAPASPAPAILLGVWLAGAALAAALLARRQAAYLTSLGRLSPLSADEPGVLRAERSGIGPAVVGALHPRIVTPADFESRFGPDERRLILAHERSHLATSDAAANTLAAALQCLGWFNPLVHLGARLMRVDQEFACDAAVVGRFPEARRVYAELLLKTQLVTQPLPIGCHWPARSEHPLKERIAMLKSPLPGPSMRAVGLAVAASIGVAAGSAAWAANLAAPVRDAVVSRVTVTDTVASATDTGDVRVERWTTTSAKVVRLAETHAAYSPPPGFAEPKGTPALRSIWLKKPTGDDLMRLYPADALAKRLSAEVVMSCHVVAGGRLNGCDLRRVDVTGEHVPDDPAADPGFGAATLQLSQLFQMEPVDAAGHPTAGTEIRIPVRFMLPHGLSPQSPR